MARASRVPNKKGRKTPLRKGGQGKPRPLRGDKLVQAAVTMLKDWSGLSPQTRPINVSTVAEKLGVTRQAIYNNDLDVEIDKYRDLQRQNQEIKSEPETIRRPPEERIKAKDEEIADLRAKLDGWIERWAAVEYNARMLGIDADKIFATIPPSDRERVGFGRGRKGDDDDDE